MKLTPITLAECQKIYPFDEMKAQVYYLGYGAAIEYYYEKRKFKKSKRDKLTRVEVRLTQIEQDIAELKSEHETNLTAFRQLGSVIGEHNKQLKTISDMVIDLEKKGFNKGYCSRPA